MGLAPPPSNGFDYRNIDIPGSTDGSVLVKGIVSPGIWDALAAGTPGDFLGITGGGLPGYFAIAGGGDMLAAVYDPSGVAASAFNLANFSIAAEAQGDIYFRGVAGWERLPAPVATNFVLTSDGANPFWAAAPGNMLQSVYDPTAVGASAFDLANFAISAEAPGDLYTRGPATWGRLATGAVRQVLTVDVTTGRPAWQDNQLPTNYADGVNVTSMTVTAVTLGVGSVRDSTDVIDIVVTAPVVLTMPADLDTGVEAADTFYDIIITRSSGGTIGGNFVVRGAAPTLPGGTTFRRVATVRNDSGSDFVPYLQQGGGRERTYLYTNVNTARLVLTAGVATVATAVSCASLIPNTTQHGRIIFNNNSSTRTVNIFQDSAGPVVGFLQQEESAVTLFPLNATQEVAYANSAGGGDTDIAVAGYVETI